MNHLYGTTNRCSVCQVALAQVREEVAPREAEACRHPGEAMGAALLGPHGAGALGSPFSSMAFIKGLSTEL